MTILTTEEAIAHCRADPVADAQMITLYLGAAEDAAQDFMDRKAYPTDQAMIDANDPDGLVANFAFKAAVLLLCGHLYANREDVTSGQESYSLPMGAHDLLRPYRRSYGL